MKSNILSESIDKTSLVQNLLYNNIIYPEDIEWWFEADNKYNDDMHPEINYWGLFPSFQGYDYERLIAASFPVLTCELWSWVGLTDNRSVTDVYTYLKFFEKSSVSIDFAIEEKPLSKTEQ